jgi:nitroreductase
MINGVEAASAVLTFLVGSYGLLLNVPHLLAAVLPNQKQEAHVDLGFVVEQIVLEATLLGLGTCWITGTYNADAAADAITLAAGETVGAVCALGRPARTRMGRLHTNLVHRVAGGRRKALSEIVFAGRWGAAWRIDEAEPALVAILEHARIAPSAANRQPWRFIARPDSIVLALARSKPIDAGIVMAHYALAAAALNVGGAWELCWGDSALARECGLPPGATIAGVFA